MADRKDGLKRESIMELRLAYLMERLARGIATEYDVAKMAVIKHRLREAAAYRRGQEEMRARACVSVAGTRFYEGENHENSGYMIGLAERNVRALPITGADNALGLPPLDDGKLHTPELITSLQKRALKLGDDD